jgi:hypothetical protein
MCAQGRGGRGAAQRKRGSTKPAAQCLYHNGTYIVAERTHKASSTMPLPQCFEHTLPPVLTATICVLKSSVPLYMCPRVLSNSIYVSSSPQYQYRSALKEEDVGGEERRLPRGGAEELSSLPRGRAKGRGEELASRESIPQSLHTIAQSLHTTPHFRRDSTMPPTASLSRSERVKRVTKAAALFLFFLFFMGCGWVGLCGWVGGWVGGCVQVHETAQAAGLTTISSGFGEERYVLVGISSEQRYLDYS